MITNYLATGLVLLAGISWNFLDPKPDTNSLEATNTRIKACLVDNTYTGTITKFGLEVTVEKSKMTITNVTTRPIRFEINRGLSQYTLGPTRSVELVNIRNQANCIQIQPNWLSLPGNYISGIFLAQGVSIGITRLSTSNFLRPEA